MIAAAGTVTRTRGRSGSALATAKRWYAAIVRSDAMMPLLCDWLCKIIGNVITLCILVHIVGAKQSPIGLSQNCYALSEHIPCRVIGRVASLGHAEKTTARQQVRVVVAYSVYTRACC